MCFGLNAPVICNYSGDPPSDPTPPPMPISVKNLNNNNTKCQVLFSSGNEKKIDVSSAAV